MLSIFESKLSPMKTYGDRLEHALRIAKRDRGELSAAIDISIQAIGQVIAGKTKALTAENSARAARFLNVDHFWLATGEGEPRPENVGWPFPGVTAEECARLQQDQIEEIVAIINMKLDRLPPESTKKSA